MEKASLKIKDWIKNNKFEFFILLGILFIAAFVRLYKIDQYMTFLGDEGRDVIIVRRLLVSGHPPLIGPGTSIGNMYLGPLYYYMMAPALLLANFSPVGPAVMIALLGVGTVFLLWFAGRVWFGKKVALIASGLYAISPIVIIYSRSSWNPNIMPFFSLLSIYSIWKVWRDHKFDWLMVLGVSYAFVLQSHYLGLLLAPTIFIFWLLVFKDMWSKRSVFIRYSLLAILLFIILMSPLFFFDLRHNWINARAMYEFFTVRQTTVSIKPWTGLPKIPEIFDQINTTLVAAGNNNLGAIVSFVALITTFYFFVSKKIKNKAPFLLILSWTAFGLIGFGIYKQNIYAHYFGFMFVIPYLFIALITKPLNKYLTALVVLPFICYSVINTPLKLEPNNMLGRARDVARKIEQESGGEKFNLGVIAERNYEDGYKYFLLKDRVPVVNIDSQDTSSITDQLFVVCEFIPTSKCDPTHDASAAVANFGWSKVEAQWEVDGVIIYKLVHTQQ